MFLVAAILTLISVSAALPYHQPDVQNVITVPPNCPPGQELVNGQCRDIWVARNNPNAGILGMFRNRNVITVPPNCPPGQELINGVCRDVWRYFVPTTPVPKNFEHLDIEHRERRQAYTEVNIAEFLEIRDIINRNIINIPNQCPAGHRPDALGNCRPILD